VDAEYFEEVKLGVGTARGQQGRLREAISNFEAASHMAPIRADLAASLDKMRAHATTVESATADVQNAVADVCGTPCQEIVDSNGANAMCMISWADGCGDVPPPHGFSADSRVYELCGRSCAVVVAHLRAQQGRSSQ